MLDSAEVFQDFGQCAVARHMKEFALGTIDSNAMSATAKCCTPLINRPDFSLYRGIDMYRNNKKLV